MVINEEIIKIKDSILAAVNVEKLYLFGSYANGAADEDSDYDLYIVIPDNGIRPIEAMRQARSAMWEVDVDKPIDLLAGTSEIFNRRAKGVTLERKIAREGVLLYERGE
ncbi:MAG: nucleotidyltransferase domain-containing protein [Lachnospiraceae bacterium]|jgi:predicted nucleotidyltransferase|nr:nucleotidyltransferase domain-containing protein [Lachnospiraceae bacterium]